MMSDFSQILEILCIVKKYSDDCNIGDIMEEKKNKSSNII